MPARKNDTRSVGFKGELLAQKLLKDKGYKIITRNYYTKAGEIDIIAEDGDTLVFIEVKLRKTRKFGLPEYAVTPSKLKRIKRAGEYYCLETRITKKKLRIDVVSLLFEKQELVRAKLIKVGSL